MSDYQPIEDLVAWDDWMQLQPDELLQPFPATNWNDQLWRDAGLIVPHVSKLSHMNELQHERHSTSAKNLSFTDTTQGSDGGLAITFWGPDTSPDQSTVLRSSGLDTVPRYGSPSYIYVRTGCAACGAALENPEPMLHDQDLHCSSDTSITHLSLECDEPGCGEKFPRLGDLKKHCSNLGKTKYAHRPFRCGVAGCMYRVSPLMVTLHFQKFHPDFKHRCAECGTGFNSFIQLDEHGNETMHGAYTCLYPGCDSESTRISDLTRHQLSQKKAVARYPCQHCRKYRGNNGFKRKDHLRQHIHNYHHIEQEDDSYSSQGGQTTFPCTFKDCDKVGTNSFETARLRNAHLKKEHPSQFQCPHAGCDRVGTNGWMRERDMVKHIKKAHDNLGV